MQQGTKIAVVVLAIALVTVIGLICLTRGSGTAQPITEATATPAVEQTSMPEETPQPEEGAQQAEGEEVTPQETMYEGALAGLTEEEIERFQSDFRIVANFFTQKRKNKDYIPDDPTEIKYVDEVLKLLNVMTGDKRYEKIFQKKLKKLRSKLLYLIVADTFITDA